MSVKFKLPARTPMALGENVTLTVQTALGERFAGQLFVSWKSPTAAMPEIATEAFPVFVTVTFWRALVPPTTWLPKLRVPGFVTSE